MSRLLCHCFKLTEARVRRLVTDHRCTTVEEVSDLTGACLGCRTCEPGIVAILRAVNGPPGTERPAR